MVARRVMGTGGNEHAKGCQYFGLQTFKILFMIMLVLVVMEEFGFSLIQVTHNMVGKLFQWIQTLENVNGGTISLVFPSKPPELSNKRI